MDYATPGQWLITDNGQAIALISILVSLLSALVRKATVDTEKLKYSRQQMKEHQKKLQEAQKKGDEKAMMKSQEEMSKHMMDQMSQSFKPMLITLVPFLLIFSYLSSNYGDLNPTVNATLIDHIPQAVSLQNVVASNNGTYDPSNNTVTWFFPKVHTDSVNRVTLEADVKSGTLDDLKTNKAMLSFKRNNGTGPIAVSSDETQPVQESIMTVEKNVENAGNGRVSYTITYKNVATNNVVFFPYYVDFFVFQFHYGFTYFWCYFFVSLIASIFINKAMGLT
jgi:uncharacterized membrane protein (DUF106 family)